MNYVKNTWYVAAWSHEVGEGDLHAIDILGEPIVIFRDSNGAPRAMENRCAHRLAPLSLGRCEGNNVRCMYHGWLYSPEGKVVEVPGQAEIPPHQSLKTYPVVEKHSWLWVWMGDPAQADESVIPPAVGMDDPDYILGSGHLDYEAEAELINNNLLDFSHLTYVHAESFQPGTSFSDNPPTITSLPNGVRFSRWVKGKPVSAAASSRVMNTTSDDGAMDGWSSYDFLLPGILLMKTGDFPPGTAAACDGEAPDFSLAIGGVTHTSQAVTPMGEGRSRYFFNWGPHKDFGDEAVRDMLMQIAGQAFGEDKVMIEAQQKVVLANTTREIAASSHDRGLFLFERMVKRRIADEQGC